MRIVTWNCNGAFRRKFEKISELDADVYIIQECEDPIRALHSDYKSWASNYIWDGDSKNRGLGIFVKPDLELQRLNWSDQYEDHKVKYFLPCSINQKFNILGVWAHRNNSPNFGYIGQVWKYLKINGEKMSSAFVVGDFNSNVIWDQWDRWWNHSDVLREFANLGVESYYHKFFNEEQGKESKPTLFLQKNREKAYHIDNIFGCQSYTSKITNFEIGNYEDWISYSDHVPVVLDFIFPITNNQ